MKEEKSHAPIDDCLARHATCQACGTHSESLCHVHEGRCNAPTTCAQPKLGTRLPRRPVDPGDNRIKLCVLETASGADKGLTVEDPGVPQSVRDSSQERNITCHSGRH